MILFDIGANRGDAVEAGIARGFTKIVALEPGPEVFAMLVKNYIYSDIVIPLKFAVSESMNEKVTFYDCVEDGLSTLNKDWLTDESMPYVGKQFREISAVTCTIDWLVERYGSPDLIKIDVEGGEWLVFRGMTKKYGMLTFEWTKQTIPDHNNQIQYLRGLGYKEYAPQFITHHLQEPDKWYKLTKDTDLGKWVEENAEEWESGKWLEAHMRHTADVGMLWVR